MMVFATNIPRKDRVTRTLFVLKSTVPGKTWIVNAPIMIAATASPGTPSVSIGIMAPPVTPLLPPSEAATASGPLQEQFRMFGHSAGGVVSNEGSDIGTCTGDDADDGSDETGNRSDPEHGLHISLSKKSCDCRIDLVGAVDILSMVSNALAHREESDHDRDILDAGEKVCVVCETDIACHTVDANGSC